MAKHEREQGVLRNMEMDDIFRRAKEMKADLQADSDLHGEPVPDWLQSV